jgi:hypothetical protein
MTLSGIRSGNLARPIDIIKTMPDPVLHGSLAGAAPFASVFAKLTNETKRSIELVCAWLGHALELPLPLPVLVRVLKSRMPLNLNWPFSSEEVLVYGSLAIPEARPIVSGALRGEELKALVHKWKHLERAAVFDHLIANDDRSEANVLLSPDRQLWLIDHARSLGGGGDRLFSSEFFPSTEGYFLKTLAQMGVSERVARRPSIVKACIAASTAVSQIPYERLMVPDVTARQIDTYLSQRADQLIPMILHALGLPDLTRGDQDSPGAVQ